MRMKYFRGACCIGEEGKIWEEQSKTSQRKKNQMENKEELN